MSNSSRLDRRGLAPLHGAIVGPEQPRRHRPPRPPELPRAAPSPWRSAARRARTRAAPPPAARGRRPARRRRGRGRTADRGRRSRGRCRDARPAPRALRRPGSAARPVRSRAVGERRASALSVLIFAAERPSARSFAVRARAERGRVERVEGRARAGPRSPSALAVRELLADHDPGKPGEAVRPPRAASGPSPATASTGGEARVGGQQRGQVAASMSALRMRMSWTTWRVGQASMSRGRAVATHVQKPMSDARLPLRAEPERLPASRPCLLGAAQLATWRAPRAAASCCASRTSTATRCRPEYEAAIYEDLAWLGLAWEEPVRRQSRALRRLSRGAGAARGAGARSIPLREPRRDRPHRSRDAEQSAAPGRAIPMARRSIPARPRRPAKAELPPHGGGEPYALRLDMAAALARRAGWRGGDWQRKGGDGGRGGRSRPIRPPGATSCLARTRDADQLSSRRWWSTTRCRA